MSQEQHNNFFQKDFLPFCKPSIGKAEIEEVVDSLKSGWITTGPKVKIFESLLAGYCHAPHALTLSSATAGLFLCLKLLELQPGDEVITVPFTFVSSVNTILHGGGTPVFVDVDPHTFNIDVSCLERAITKRTRAILPVHYAGMPVDLDPIYDLANQYNLRVIEDCAHAIGAKYKGKPLGSFGDMQVFSFHPNKNMTTGEGGVVILKDEAEKRQIERLRFHGIDREAWNRFAKSGSQEYDVVIPGYKFNLMDIQAAIGIHQIQKLDNMIEKRTFFADRYRDYFRDRKGLRFQGHPDYDFSHAWHLYLMKIDPEVLGMNRAQFMDEMKRRNIGLGLHYQAVHTFSYYQKTFGYQKGQFPVAEDLGETVVSLPLFPDMTLEEQDNVCAAIDDILGK